MEEAGQDKSKAGQPAAAAFSEKVCEPDGPRSSFDLLSCQDESSTNHIPNTKRPFVSDVSRRRKGQLDVRPAPMENGVRAGSSTQTVLRGDRRADMSHLNLAVPGLLTRKNGGVCLERKGRRPADCNRSSIHVHKHLRAPIYCRCLLLFCCF